MDFFSAMLATQNAEETSYSDTYRSYVGGEVPPTLTDEESALVVFVAMKKKGVTTESGSIMVKLPDGCKEHFKTVRKMKIEHDPFFERFALLVKAPEDGMLWGTGTEVEYPWIFYYIREL